MKKTLTILASALCLSLAQAQQGYRSFFGQESTEWYIEDRSESGSSSAKYFFLGDTLYDGKQYRLVYRVTYGQEYSPEAETEPMLFAAVREDTASGKMWVNDLFPSREETLLVDMSQEVGDVFQPWHTVVETSVDSSGRKVIVFNDGSRFVEGIGPTAPSPSFTGAHSSHLLCAYHDGIRLFQASFLNPEEYDLEHCTAKHIGLPSVAPPTLAVFPNPTTGTVHLRGLPDETVSAHTFDAHGSMVLSVVLAPGRHELDLSCLPRGVYFLNLNELASSMIKLIKI